MSILCDSIIVENLLLIIEHLQGIYVIVKLMALVSLCLESAFELIFNVKQFPIFKLSDFIAEHSAIVFLDLVRTHDQFAHLQIKVGGHSITLQYTDLHTHLIPKDIRYFFDREYDIFNTFKLIILFAFMSFGP